ncbi:MAG: hypothetical protein R3A50_09930 [Saprospiraceae bacterium]
MKHILLIFACALFSTMIQAQTYRCAFSGASVKPIVTQVKNDFDKKLERVVEDILDEIAKEIGVNSYNYRAYPSSNVRNFQVEFDESSREFNMYYSLTFLNNLYNTLSQDQQLLDIIFVITAHEFGHNLNGHVHIGGCDPKMELEADYFAGKTAAKHEIPYVFAVKVYNMCTSVGSTSTHPGRSERIESFRNGYKNGQ